MILASDILNGRARPAPTLRDLLRGLRPQRGTGRDSASATLNKTPVAAEGAAQHASADQAAAA